MNLKQLYQKPIILPAFIAFTYSCLFLDTIKYPGFVGGHFFIDSKIYFAVTLVLILFSISKSRFLTFVLKINQILLLLLSVIYLGLAADEGAHFTNYVLATFRIHLDGLVLVVLFGLSVFLSDKFKSLLPKKAHVVGIIYPVMIFLITYFMIKNLSFVVDEAVNRDSYVVFHPLSSYDQKMYYQWGDFYRFMVFVRNNTPTDATIILPPMENPWLIGSGNPHFVRSFLYPREIFQETKIIPDLKDFGPKTYILITWGKEACNPDPECHGWPRQDILAKKIIYKDPNSVGVIGVKENTVYKLKDSQYVYGVIEI